MINKDGLQRLIEQQMFHLVKVYGLDTPYDEIKQHLLDDGIEVDDEQMLRDAYDFVDDQSGINYLASPVTQDVLNLVDSYTSQHLASMNKTPEEIRDTVFQFLQLQGQVDERTADSVSFAVLSLLNDLRDGDRKYK